MMVESMKHAIGLMLVICATASPVRAQSPFDAFDAARDQLRKMGLDLTITDANFLQGFVGGAGPKRFSLGGQLSTRSVLDFGRVGMVDGLSLTTRFNQNYGKSVNGLGGALLPANVTLAFPGMDGQSGDLSSFYLTQRLGDTVSLSLGKFDMVERAAATPLVGGGQVGGFMHLGLAAPATGVTPAYLFGAMATLRTAPAIFTLMVYDPVSAVRRDPFRGLFNSGGTALGAVTIPTSFFGLGGLQSIKYVVSSARGVDYSHLQDAFLPSLSSTYIPKKTGIWYASYSFQQYLSEDPSVPGKGWGVFGQASVSDGNPTFIDWSVLAGLAGSSPLSERPNDKFGVGYFRYSLSDALIDALRPLTYLGDEQGVEVFYNLAVTSRIGVTADVQIIKPTQSRRPDVLYTGVRTQITF
jgi:porin